ncbi:MAG: pyridoxal phosphate-dependent aminotransferase [Firmicutes bacterium]|nr:pyridoxal phosphate-dependent aminotransferase [Bacillota bacterium]
MRYDFDKPIDRRNTNSYKWDIAERHMGCEDVLGMWTADMDFQSPPPMLDTLRKRLDHGVLGYTIRGERYYEIIQNWLQRRFGWTLGKEAVHFCPPGVIPAVCMLVEVLTKPGDALFAFMPNYDSLYGAAEAMGRRLVTAPLKCPADGPKECADWKMDLEAFERIAQEEQVKAVLFCSPHNPVGRVWTAEELAAFGEICRRRNIFVISDEVHCDIVRDGVKHTPMGSVPGMEDLSATLMSPNKSFNVAGLMTASVFIPNREVMAAFRRNLSSWAMTLDTVFGTLAVEELYSDPACEDWLDQANAYLSGNLEYAVSYIRQHIPDIRTYVPEGTYLLWLDFSATSLRGAELRRFLVQECGLDLCDGWEFDPAVDDHMRLNCACTRATLEEAMKRLAHCRAK